MNRVELEYKITQMVKRMSMSRVKEILASYGVRKFADLTKDQLLELFKTYGAKEDE